MARKKKDEAEAEAEGRKSSAENKARQLKGSRHVAIDKFASIARFLPRRVCMHSATREKEKENEGKKEREKVDASKLHYRKPISRGSRI